MKSILAGLAGVLLIGQIENLSADAFPATAPEISITKAADLVDELIEGRGLSGKVYVASLALTRDGAFSNVYYWKATWSQELPTQKPGQKEVGAKVTMDGGVIVLVKS
jgi:hypothetical protein